MRQEREKNFFEKCLTVCIWYVILCIHDIHNIHTTAKGGGSAGGAKNGAGGSGKSEKMEILRVEGLCKSYEGFALKDVSFTLDEGYIMGFIGRNGAGKTTTIKSILGLIHADSGRVTICGHDLAAEELACKQQVGVVLGEFDYYKRYTLSGIAQIYKRFYDKWNDAAFLEYMKKFELVESKKINELSSGMKVKFALALALSHDARLLILDEPTSGLDPVSRDELLSIFQGIIEDGRRSVFLSTHITSDLERRADFITYIKDGRIIASEEQEIFVDAYRTVNGRNDMLTEEMKQKLIGLNSNRFGFDALIRTEDVPLMGDAAISPADLESIMIHMERE